MKSILLLINCLLFSKILAASVTPSWTVDLLLNSGEAKPVNKHLGPPATPSTFNATQPFNASFTSPPRVALSLFGYKQEAPCTNCQVGYQISITSVSASSYISNVSIYGANIWVLHYFYLGIDNAAIQYSIDYQLLQFNSGNLIDTNASNRTITNIYNNVGGENYPEYQTHEIVNLIYLTGFKMSLGATGTYINLTTSVINATAHSVTIATIADVKIFEVSYFRISCDRTAVMQGYISIIDIIRFFGWNSTQQIYTSSMTAASMQYRNCLMGFNHIYIASTTAATNFHIAFYLSYVTLFTTSAQEPLLDFNTMPTYAYLNADVFHHRKRVCPGPQPYFYIDTQLCYDVCPITTFPKTTPANYCQKCHYSCLTCNGVAYNSCLSCNTSLTRNFNNSTNTCFCSNGYYQTINKTCSQCSSPCLTCNLSSTQCTSCDTALYRVLNSSQNTCECQSRFYESLINSSYVCLACQDTCLTCVSAANTCTSCDSATHFRSLNSSNNICQCINGYFETSLNDPVICLQCDETCVTCQSSSTFCNTCNDSHYRTLNVTTHKCECNNGYFETSVNNPTICLTCDSTCLTCQSTSNHCTTCDNSTHYRQLNATSHQCVCSNGYYDVNISAVCSACSATCQTCQSSSNYCLTCHSTNQNRVLNLTTHKCECIDGYYETSSNVPLVCLACSDSCLTCSLSASHCTSCNFTLNQALVNNKCVCMPGYYQNNLNQCIPCPASGCPDPKCGNGIIQSGQGCDDSNSISLDGCSSSCLVQKYHTCETTTFNNGTSLCYYNKPLDMNIGSVMKLINDNKVSIIVTIKALYCNMESLKKYLNSLVAIQLESARRMLQSSSVIYISSASFQITDPDNYVGYLKLILDYTASISTLQNKQLIFIGSNQPGSVASKYFFATPSSNVVLLDPQNKIPMLYYKPSTYKSTQVFSYIFLTILSLNLLFFLVMICFKRSIIAIQSILIYQFAYFSVVGLQQVELAIASLAFYGKYSTGLNINIVSNSIININQYILCPKMSKIYQQCNSINNINITFYLATVCLGIGLGLLLFKIKKQKQLNLKPIIINQNDTQSDKSNIDNINNHESSWMGEKNKPIEIVYELPKKVQKIQQICMQFAFGIYFMTAIKYLLSASNQDKTVIISSSIWLAIVGLLFVGIWFIFYYFYPLSFLSYIKILEGAIQKISVFKLVYLILFMFLLIWGLIIGLAPGIVSYIMLIIFAGVWFFLTFHKQIYKSKLHRIRATINQGIIVAIAFVYIMLEYVVKDGTGLVCAILLMILLIGSLLSNLGFCIYEIYNKRINSDFLNEKEELKEFEKEIKHFNSIKKVQINNKNPIIQLNDVKSTKKEPLIIGNKATKQGIKNKIEDLKTFKRELRKQDQIDPKILKIDLQDIEIAVKVEQTAVDGEYEDI